MKKQQVKIKDFKLPLIEQHQPRNSPINTKISSKRSSLGNLDKNQSTLSAQKKSHSQRKKSKQSQCYQQKANKQNPPQNRSFSRQKLSIQENIQDFEDKQFEKQVQRNKKILQKNKVFSSAAGEYFKKKSRFQNEKVKENSAQTSLCDKYPQIPQRVVANKRFLSILATKDSKEWVDAIMKGSQNIGCSLPNLKNPYQSRISKKAQNQLDQENYGKDVFEDVHALLQKAKVGLKKRQPVVDSEKISRKMVKLKSKIEMLQKKGEDSSCLQNTSINNSSSLTDNEANSSSVSLLISSLTFHSSEWEKISMKDKKMQKVQSSFNSQIQKLDLNSKKSSKCLDQLLDTRKQILDLLIGKKLKDKIKIHDTQ